MDEFVALLDSFAIGRVVDIRAVPRSCTKAQCKLDVLSVLLRSALIEYCRLLHHLCRSIVEVMALPSANSR
ncbi:DUF488 family protein [Pseudomonas sp. S37]|uniref:DUF488 family protein n=1 Tax=Pseudomonas sp. S37 TaxID=2767449 RepID=UPI003FA6BAFF